MTEKAALASLEAKPLYKLSGHAELSELIALHTRDKAGDPTWTTRDNILYWAKASIGTRYVLRARSLDLSAADCVSWAERTIALGVTDSWTDAYRAQNRLRYKDGNTEGRKNHRTYEDWVCNNTWLWQDWTERLGAATATMRWASKVGEAVERYSTQYVPKEAFATIAENLQTGDVCLLVGKSGGRFVLGHVGIVEKPAGGAVALWHCSPSGGVQRTPFARLISWARGDDLVGFKFVRIGANPDIRAELAKVAAISPTAFDEKYNKPRYDEVLVVDGVKYGKKTLGPDETYWGVFGPEYRTILGLPVNRHLWRKPSDSATTQPALRVVYYPLAMLQQD